MRASLCLRAVVQSGKYLEPGTPTGLTGLFTHSSPRSTLLYTYNSTLDKLKRFPEHSVYRQSAEALTKQRLSIVESVKPEGLEAWQERVKKTVEQFPEAFKKISSQAGGKEANIVYRAWAAEGMQTPEWDDEPVVGKGELEGIRSADERKGQKKAFERNLKLENAKVPRIEPEPPLSSEQINEIESKIGAGLIEEVIQVAEGELGLVDTLYEAQVWEELEESPEVGQWEYHQRQTRTSTQAR